MIRFLNGGWEFIWAWAGGLAWTGRRPPEPKVAGSNPARPATTKDKGAPPPYLSVLSNPRSGASPHNPVFLKPLGGYAPTPPNIFACACWDFVPTPRKLRFPSSAGGMLLTGSTGLFEKLMSVHTRLILGILTFNRQFSKGFLIAQRPSGVKEKKTLTTHYFYLRIHLIRSNSKKTLKL
ncbi:MAG: hypothetical protein PWQ79_1468 [Thermococcaceae archaeon]|nr:hypothetical protein [Thermococcaceae archaeon]MDK2914553.1 hypothetical protein [Thermococcaceae archaeon]